MADTPARAGFHTVTPYIMVREAEALIEFVKQAFGATETMRAIGSAGGIHAELRIGESMLMIGGARGGDPMPAALYLYLADVDAIFQRARWWPELRHWLSQRITMVATAAPVCAMPLAISGISRRTLLSRSQKNKAREKARRVGGRTGARSEDEESRECSVKNIALY